MDEPWIILRHVDYDKIVKEFLNTYLDNPDKWPFGPCVYHIEPVKRYNSVRTPAEHWEFLKVVDNANAAFGYVQEDEDKWIAALKEKKKRYVPKGNGLSLRYDILKRDGYKCQICGRDASDGMKLEVDHKIPRAKGGSNEPDNLWALCFDCNHGKSDKDLYPPDLPPPAPLP